MAGYIYIYLAVVIFLFEVTPSRISVSPFSHNENISPDVKSGVLQNQSPFTLNPGRQILLLVSLQVLLLPYYSASDMKLGCPRIGV